MHFLLTPEAIENARSMIERHLTPVADQAARGEFSVEDIITMAKEGRVYIGMSYAPEMVGAFEFTHYPRSLKINIIALGGTDFEKFAEITLEKFRGWAMRAGADHLEASCSKAMARILKRCGFESDYEVVRLPTGKTNAYSK